MVDKKYFYTFFSDMTFLRARIYIVSISFATIKGLENVMLLSNDEEPRIDNVVFLFDFGCGVELSDRETDENGAFANYSQRRGARDYQ